MFNYFRKVIKRKEAPDRSLRVSSVYLERRVRVDIYYSRAGVRRPMQALFFNDGQDMQAVQLYKALQLHADAVPDAPAYMVVAVYPADRMQEYGTSQRADYAGRGSQAGEYARFLTEELIPLLQYRFHLSEGPHCIAGFSLGGLSAFDLGWNHSDLFDRVGVFSGALWWRSKSFRQEAPDADRIVHAMVQEHQTALPGLRFWFQTGTEDEKEDRNGNGIIDAIDDTLDLMAALLELGYPTDAVEYVEIEGGEHNPKTWAKVLPDFLGWAFPSSQPKKRS